MTVRDEGLRRRLERLSRARGALSAPVARARLAHCVGPVDEALALEALVGGCVVSGYELGIDTHREHPPYDAYDRWLDATLERQLVQIAWGGPRRATYWLDDAGWVHELSPLDRLRPVSARIDEFLSAVLDDRFAPLHYGLLAISPLEARDAALLFDARERCPVGPGVALWSTHARRFLEEREGIAHEREPLALLSAPTLDELATPLCELLQLEPALEVTTVDAFPAPLYETVGSTELVAFTARHPYDAAPIACAVVRDRAGAVRIAVQHPR